MLAERSGVNQSSRIPSDNLFPPSQSSCVKADTNATLQPRRTVRSASPGVRRLLRLLLTYVFSFEAAFVLFLYSNNIKLLLPALPIDETIPPFLLSLVGFFALLIRRGIRADSLPLLISALLFFGWMALTMLWSPGRDNALRSLSYNIVWNFFCLLVGALIIGGDRHRMHRAFFFIVCVGLLLTWNGLLIYFTYGTFRYYSGLLETRAYLAWTHPVASAGAIVLTVALTAPFASGRQIAGLVLAALFGFFLLVGGARAPLLAFLTAFLIPTLLVAPSIDHGRLTIPKVQLLALVLLGIVASYIGTKILTGDLTDTLSRLVGLGEYIEKVGTSERHNRLSYWAAALRFWSQSPIAGNGIGSFAAMYTRGGWEDPGTHPHNIILEVLTDLGLLGLLLFIGLIVAAGREFRMYRVKRDAYYLCCWVLLLSTLLGKTTMSQDMAGHWELFFWIGLLSGFCWRSQARESEAAVVERQKVAMTSPR